MKILVTGGAGFIGSWVADTFIEEGHEVVGIDIAQGAVEACKKRGIKNVYQKSAGDLDFADGEFDHVFVCFVLEHVNDPLRALAAIKRVLRPGGSLVLKLMEGPEAQAAEKRLRSAFDKARSLRPEASRKGTTERYLVAHGLR